MSGSSLDGIDLALVSFEKDRWHLEKFKAYDLPTDLKQALRSTPSVSAIELAHTEASYTDFMITCLKEFDVEAEAIGIHGHTILHLPEIQTSWQLVNAGKIAAQLNLPTVSDFRNQDMALGGQGTPMAVIADRDLFPGYDHYINLGGIANLSINDKDGWLAYDVGPCNQLLNHYSSFNDIAYDKDGTLARSGQPNEQLLEQFKAEPYYKLPPPKSLDNNWIKETYLQNSHHGIPVADCLRTAVTFITDELANLFT